MRVGKISEFKCPGCAYTGKHFHKIDETLKCQECGDNLLELTPVPGPYWKPYTPGYHSQFDQFFQTKDDERRYAKRAGMTDITGLMSDVRNGRFKAKNRGGY